MSGLDWFDDDCVGSAVVDKCNDLDDDHSNNQSLNFFGCYILVSLNPKHRGRTYIGFTVNPNRRIRQHNAGRFKGGAKSTAGKGPWEMVLIVHGFPNSISALRFEWAWQNPKLSRRLKNTIIPKKSRETCFDYRLRILAAMLCVGPWNRLGLTIRWIKQDYARKLSEQFTPPLHMPIVFGPIEEKSNHSSDIEFISSGKCQLCECPFKSDAISTSVPLICPGRCENGRWHLFCLARYMLDHENLNNSNKYLIPLSSLCPACGEVELLWSMLIDSWKKRSFHLNSANNVNKV